MGLGGYQPPNITTPTNFYSARNARIASAVLATSIPSSHQLKSYVASKSRLKLAARAVLSADAGLLVCC